MGLTLPAIPSKKVVDIQNLAGLDQDNPEGHPPDAIGWGKTVLEPVFLLRPYHPSTPLGCGVRVCHPSGVSITSGIWTALGVRFPAVAMHALAGLCRAGI